jgi:hypothetical protein
MVMADVIFVDGGLYSQFQVDQVKEGDFLLLPDKRMFFVERLDEANARTKIVPIDSAEGPIPTGSRVVKLELYDRVN